MADVLEIADHGLVARSALASHGRVTCRCTMDFSSHGHAASNDAIQAYVANHNTVHQSTSSDDGFYMRLLNNKARGHVMLIHSVIIHYICGGRCIRLMNLCDPRRWWLRERNLIVCPGTRMVNLQTISTLRPSIVLAVSPVWSSSSSYVPLPRSLSLSLSACNLFGIKRKATLQ
mmetsp:Transcript_5076/g.13568  ORF Transcript_5076/g.13568 Transcript_5076/m.13568 type:complete len:174 (-) Transcript_5076:645-1166(-)